MLKNDLKIKYSLWSSKWFLVLIILIFVMVSCNDTKETPEIEEEKKLTPEEDKELRSEIDKLFSGDEESLKKIVSMGEKAIPVLVEIGCKPTTTGGNSLSIHYCLKEIGSPALDYLRKKMRTGENDLKILLIIEGFYQEGAPAVPEIIEMAKRTKGYPQIHIARVLNNIGPKAISAVPVLIEFLENNEIVYVRSAAAMALGKMKESKEAQHALEKALKSEKDALLINELEKALQEFEKN